LGEPERGQAAARIGVGRASAGRGGLASLRSTQSGFTMLELLVASAVIALLVALALPAYLGARDKAAIDEGNSMADQWRTLVWGCYLQNTNNWGSCTSDSAIGFSETPGKYWNWTSGSDSYRTVVLGATASTALGIQVWWPSMNNGLEIGETFVVTIPVNGNEGLSQAVTNCIPYNC